MRKASKIAAAAVGLMLVGGATAAAVTAPDAADDGLTTAEGKAGFELPAANEDHPTPEDHPGGGSAESNDAADGTHGAEVSVVAQGDTTGRDHGEAVSAVARGDHGQAPATTPNARGTAAADEASNGASTVGTSRAALGSGNAGEHGKP